MDHPEREYDELEKFYQEETFAHVGGSYLLGKASELMSVPEYEGDEDAMDDSSGKNNLAGDSTHSADDRRRSASNSGLSMVQEDDEMDDSIDSEGW